MTEQDQKAAYDLTTVICPECLRRVNARRATGGLLMNLGDHEHGCDRAGTVKTEREMTCD